MSSSELFFTDMVLDRQNSRRKSSEWLDKHIKQANTKFIAIWQSNYFFHQNELVILSSDLAFNLTVQELKRCSYLLGEERQPDNNCVFILDLSLLFDEERAAFSFVEQWLEKAEQFEAKLKLNQKIDLLNFRQCLHLLTDECAAKLGYGRALTAWHHSSAYCGYCGSETRSIEAGHSRACINQQCQKVTFPRTDPVVIMIVDYQQGGQPAKCLLAGHHRSPDNLVSTLAGFVDPGESVEQAVKREIFEEVGLEVEQVQYIASQPWPFPHSLMMGFYATAKSDQITIDTEEIRDAQWFSAEQVANFSNWGDDDENIQIPTKVSISRHLIDWWVNRNILK